MDDRKIVRELTKIFGVSATDLPRTIKRFKDEIDHMEAELKNIKK